MQAVSLPIYDIEKSYLYNAEEGPFFKGPYPERKWPEKEQWIDFLGYKIASPLGVAAGPLLNSKWIACAANLGFDLLCYKTIRSAEHPGHPVPNMIYVECEEQLIPGSLPEALKAKESPPRSLEKIAVTNSFGMPSRSSAYLAEDIPKAQQLLHPGQQMIVSVVGSPNSHGCGGILEDFVVAAAQAKSYGAKIIEANFSCPNVTTGEGSLYDDPAIVGSLAKKIVDAIGDIPLIIKVGIFKEKAAMEQVFVQAARAGVRAICGINTISMKVLDEQGGPALGAGRSISGICGYPIREAAISFTKDAYAINRKNKLGLTIMTTGGVLRPEHFEDFLDVGADIAMTAMGMMWDPYIAMRYHLKESHGNS